MSQPARFFCLSGRRPEVSVEIQRGGKMALRHVQDRSARGARGVETMRSMHAWMRRGYPEVKVHRLRRHPSRACFQVPARQTVHAHQ
jgi:hypothetical protein